MDPNRLPATVLLGAILIAAPDPVLAGAWTQAPGEAYLRVSAGGLDTRSRYDATGMRVGFQEAGGGFRESEYRSREVRIYAEYGLLAAATAYGSFEYKDLRLEQTAVQYETHGGGDVRLGGRVRLKAAPFPLSIAGEAKIPTGYSIEDQPALGGGKADFGVRALAGASFGVLYTTGDVGYTLRTGAYRDEINYSAEVGRRVIGPLYGRGVLRGTHALGSPDQDPTSVVFDPGLASPRWTLLDGVLGVDIGADASLEVGISHALSGRDALAGNTFEIAWVTRFARGP